MLGRFRFSLLPALCAVVFLAGCGGVNPNPVVPPPTGTFTNSSLSGTYIFSFSGYDLGYGGGSYFAVTGSLTANGSGALTGGSIDIVDPALGAALNVSSTLVRVPVSGSYSVTGDGRGSGTLNFTVNGASVQFGLDFVLNSGAHGLITRFDGNGSGSGSLDVQTGGLTQSSLAGSWAFALNGTDATAWNPLASAGALTFDSSGNLTAGVEDFNDNGNSAGLQALGVTGSVSVGAPGAAQLTTNAGGFGTMSFDVWPVDASHFKLIETDGHENLAGDAVASTGSTAFPSGPLVFTLSGEDSQQGSFAAGGLLTSSGSGSITGGLEDVNDEGYVGQAPAVTGSFSSSGPRSVLTLNGVYNGSFPNYALATGNYTFAVYPFSGGAMLLEIDNGGGSTLGISSGNLYVQSATAFTVSQGYGLNLSGVNGNGETDWIAEFTANPGSVAGLYDANNSGYLVPGASLGSGTWSVASNGLGSVSMPGLQTSGNSMIGALNLDFYVVDSSTVVFLETDPNQLGLGAFLVQNASDAPAAVPSHASGMHLTRPKVFAGRTFRAAAGATPER